MFPSTGTNDENIHDEFYARLKLGKANLEL